jgi:sec-independent protein translocase protein TatA
MWPDPRRAANLSGPPTQGLPVFDLSPIQILIVLVIALLVFGPKRLPEMGRSIGRGIREFKGAMLDDEPPRTAEAPRETVPGPPVANPAGERTDDVLEGVIVPGDAPPPRQGDS